MHNIKQKFNETEKSGSKIKKVSARRSLAVSPHPKCNGFIIHSNTSMSDSKATFCTLVSNWIKISISRELQIENGL